VRSSTARAGERAELLRVAGEVVGGARALLGREAAVDVEDHGAVLLARRLDGGGIGRVAAALPVDGEIGQALLCFLRTQDGEQFGLQALVIAVAKLIEQGRALRILRYALNLRSGQPPQPVLQSLDVALGAALAALALS